ncbi:MAG: glycosyltransferase family 1 protein [Planctomycetota bacterium]|nr:MAG: glycosyltransferase family 1 protein [Planctomycetota bacterium]
MPSGKERPNETQLQAFPDPTRWDMIPPLQRVPRRIFIDASYTLTSGRNTGVERVVRNLVEHSQAIGRQGEIPIPGIAFQYRDRFYQLNEGAIGRLKRAARFQSNAVAALPAIYRRSAESLCRTIPSRRLRKWFLPAAGRLGIFSIWHLWNQFRNFRWIGANCTPIEFSSGDLLVLPDAYWTSRLLTSTWQAAAVARSSGATVVGLIYDLIPLLYPQFVGPRGNQKFRQYLTGAVATCDRLVCISRTVSDELQAFLPRLEVDPQRWPNITHFQLGAELRPQSGRVREFVRSTMLAAPPAFLKVATLDPRKNHHFVLDAFDRLWRSGSAQRLVLAGRIGTSCMDVVQRVRQHPKFNSQLFLFNDLSDAEIQFCYEHCRGVIFASITEGFGLPIVESLWHSKPTLASDIPIHREVGGGACRYFPLTDPQRLVEEVQRLAESPQATTWDGSGDAHQRPIDWETSCRQFLQRALEAYRSRPTDRALHPAA